MFQLCRKDRCERSDRTTRYECITERTNIMRKTLTTLLAAALAVSSLALVSSANDEVSVQSDCQHSYRGVIFFQGWVCNDEYMHSYHIKTYYQCRNCGASYETDDQTDAGWHSCDVETGTGIRYGQTVTFYTCNTCGGTTYK